MSASWPLPGGLGFCGKAIERAVMGGLGPGGLMYHNFEECGIIHPFLNEEVYEKHKMAIKPLR